MKNAVDQVFKLLWLKENDRALYQTSLEFGDIYAERWDDPTWSGK